MKMSVLDDWKDTQKIWDNACCNVEVKKKLFRLAAIGERMRWIPVSERLPKDGQTVWITFINEAGKHTGGATFKQGKFYYVAETDNGYYEEVYSCVTHWMPLPEPPAENDRPEGNIHE
jgi:hypothetical protein